MTQGSVPEVAVPDSTEEVAWRDLRQLLDDELSRLPEKYRVPVVLCYLEGLTHAEAARRLGCPSRTLTTRLTRASERLRKRLSRRGVALGDGALTAGLPAKVLSVSLPLGLAGGTARAASLFVVSQASAASAVGQAIVALAEATLQSMVTRLQVTVAVLLAVGVLGGSAGFVTYHHLAAAPHGLDTPDRPAWNFQGEKMGMEDDRAKDKSEDGKGERQAEDEKKDDEDEKGEKQNDNEHKEDKKGKGKKSDEKEEREDEDNTDNQGEKKRIDK
jgi:hypothetical protein